MSWKPEPPQASFCPHQVACVWCPHGSRWALHLGTFLPRLPAGMEGSPVSSDLGCGAAGRLPGPCVRGPAAGCRIEEGCVRSARGLLGFLSLFSVSIPAWSVLGTDLVSLCRNRPGSELCAHGGVVPVTDPVRLGLGPSAGDPGTGWPWGLFFPSHPWGLALLWPPPAPPVDGPVSAEGRGP